MRLSPYLAATAAMGIGVGAVAWLRPEPGAGPAMVLGCAVALVNGAAAAMVNRLAMGCEMHTFLVRTGIGHGLRVAVLLLVVGGGLVYGMPHAGCFGVAVALGYFCFLAAEIAAWRVQVRE